MAGRMSATYRRICRVKMRNKRRRSKGIDHFSAVSLAGAGMLTRAQVAEALPVQRVKLAKEDSVLGVITCCFPRCLLDHSTKTNPRRPEVLSSTEVSMSRSTTAPM